MTNGLQFYGLDPEEEELDTRQLEVLSVLSEDKNATYSFQGLRRKLGFHQEMLSRTLDRLEDQDLVLKTNDGYRINPNKSELNFDYTIEVAPIDTEVVKAHLPSEVNVNLVLNTLKGRWFHGFRWLGYSETDSGFTLSWMTEDGGIQLKAKIMKQTLTISALFRSESDRGRATTSAFQLFNLISRSTRKNSVKHSLPN